MTDPEPLYHLTRRLLAEHRHKRMLRQLREALVEGNVPLALRFDIFLNADDRAFLWMIT